MLCDEIDLARRQLFGRQQKSFGSVGDTPLPLRDGAIVERDALLAVEHDFLSDTRLHVGTGFRDRERRGGQDFLREALGCFETVLVFNGHFEDIVVRFGRNEIGFTDPFISGFVETCGTRVGDLDRAAFFLHPREKQLPAIGVSGLNFQRHTSRCGIFFRSDAARPGQHGQDEYRSNCSTAFHAFHSVPSKLKLPNANRTLNLRC